MNSKEYLDYQVSFMRLQSRLYKALENYAKTLSPIFKEQLAEIDREVGSLIGETTYVSEPTLEVSQEEQEAFAIFQEGLSDYVVASIKGRYDDTNREWIRTYNVGRCIILSDPNYIFGVRIKGFSKTHGAIHRDHIRKNPHLTPIMRSAFYFEVDGHPYLDVHEPGGIISTSVPNKAERLSITTVDEGGENPILTMAAYYNQEIKRALQVWPTRVVNL